MNVKIIADSACDLPDSYIEQYEIERIPLTVHLEGQDYKDAVDIQSKTVYDAMRDGKEPKTSQPTPHAFKEMMGSYLENGQPVLYLAFSSQLSGTYQASTIAAEELKETYPNSTLEIMDTHCASLGYGLVVLRAAQAAQQGESLEQVKDIARYHMDHMEHIFTVDDLEYLKRGGRVSKTAAFVGTMLKIKPLLHVEDGKLIPLEKIRGSKKVLKRMLEVMEERGSDLANQQIAISHGDDLERAEQLAELIKEQYGNHQILIHPVGSSIGAHSGPGTIALFFLNTPYK
ncbi:hypothetical protein N781_15210 [Pontibacillus halophilus JSM 076056 = DSM 19796]|uniref:DegV family protein n=1 Tax=Pontibacillus halophilus JSM 076056 = DSM 19796 TaxID=1385510 RepID=A0A0A5GL03_9BACI|nr:DegV family protein [Pontibacillus halophilus]KGX92664.1 hypothetical protein N781_15210 [Pontibacillus halophilus JSM 076056 = DSM 19796]